jgi:hypothetical protein
MVTMGIFPFKEKSPWQNWQLNPGSHDQKSETMTTRPSGWSVCIGVEFDIGGREYMQMVVVYSNFL